ncbi:MAG: HAD family hydrolase [Pseudomonadota bacterium]
MLNVIFDVDGTLVDSDALDGALFLQAVSDVLGQVTFRDDWVDYPHVSDAGILADIIQDNGFSPGTGLEQKVRDRFGTLITSALDEAPCQALPGATAVTAQLATRPGTALGVATGGWGHTARAKLVSAGFNTGNWTIASSDDHHERTSIMTSCLARLPERGERTVYFGDGLWDLRACEELGWAFVGVGPQLSATAPVWIEHFADCDLEQVLRAALDKGP